MRVPKPWLRNKTGTWHVQIDGKQVYLGKDEAKAMEKFQRLMSSGATGDYTLRQVLQFYWAWAKKNLAESTCKRRSGVLTAFSRSVRANLPASDLRAFHVQRFIDSQDRVKSPTTVGDYITLFKGIMQWAKGMGYIDRNPIEDMPKPAANVRQEFVPVAEWSAVLKAATDEPFRDWLIIMLATGARAEEMFKLEARFFDGGKFVLPIQKSKGRRKSRVVHVPNEIHIILKRWIDRYPEGLLLRNSKGVPWNKDSINCRFKRLKRELKNPKICATTLRHSYAHARLTVAGQSASEVAKLMGHADTRMVDTRYGHLEADGGFMAKLANGMPIPSLLGIGQNPLASTLSTVPL